VAPPDVARPAVVQRIVDAPPSASPRPGLGPPLARTPRTAVPVPPDHVESGEVPRESGEVSIESARLDRDLPRVAEKAAEQGFTEVPVPIQRSSASAPVIGPVSSRARQQPAEATVPPPVEPAATELTLARSVDPVAKTPTPQVEVEPAKAPVVEGGEDVPAQEPSDVPPVEEPAGDVPVPVPVAEQPTSVPDAPYVEPPPAQLPSAPLPLAGGIATSIQRAALLPGPGAPTPSLVVRPAPLVPTRPSRERVVPIQRLAIGESPTSRSSGSSTPGFSAAGRTPPDPPPVQRSAAPPYSRATSAASVTADVTGPIATVAADDTARPAEVIAVPASVPTGSRAAALAPPVTVQRADTRTTRSGSTPPAVPPVMPLASPPTPTIPTIPTVSIQAAAQDQPVDVAGTNPTEAGPHPEGTSAATTGPGAVTVQTAAAPAAAPAAAAGAPAKGGGSATGDVDALAQKLFPAVLRRIKSELLLDRERRGVRTDPW
jgi:hypothetical protein